MMGFGGAKLFAQAYKKSDESDWRLCGHCVHGVWAEFYRRGMELVVSPLFS